MRVLISLILLSSAIFATRVGWTNEFGKCSAPILKLGAGDPRPVGIVLLSPTFTATDPTFKTIGVKRTDATSEGFRDVEKVIHYANISYYKSL